MNTKDIEKREELCRLLNMDFDEAGELFSDETMKSMQMAQVNGGIVWIPVIISGAKWLCAAIGTTAAGIAIYEFIKGDDDDNNKEQGSISSGPTLPFTTNELQGIIKEVGKIPTDSTKFQLTKTGFEFTLYNPGRQ